MTLLQLTYVLELSYYRSFSYAASKLNISQPALSIQINRLEQELGLVLFKRLPGNVSLTSEGEIFVEKVRGLMKMVDDLKELPIELENKPEGELHIGVIPTLAPYWLSLFMSDFAQKYPHIQITISELKTEDIVSNLKNGKLDAGFISTPISASGLVFEPMFYEYFYLYVSDKHELFDYDSIDLATVDLKEMWYLQEGNCFQNQVDSVCIYAKEPGEYQNIVYLSNSIESLCRVVEQSGGITFIPEMATLSVAPDKEHMIKEIVGNRPVREISLVTSKISRHERLVRLFVDVALQNIPRRMKERPKFKSLDTNLRF